MISGKKTPRAQRGAFAVGPAPALAPGARDGDDRATVRREALDQLLEVADLAFRARIGARFHLQGLAHADRLDLRPVDALAYEVRLHRVSAPLRQLLVVLLGADAVGVSLDVDQLDRGELGEPRDHFLVGLRPRLGRQYGLVEVEQAGR